MKKTSPVNRKSVMGASTNSTLKNSMPLNDETTADYIQEILEGQGIREELEEQLPGLAATGFSSLQSLLDALIIKQNHDNIEHLDCDTMNKVAAKLTKSEFDTFLQLLSQRLEAIAAGDATAPIEGCLKLVAEHRAAELNRQASRIVGQRLKKQHAKMEKQLQIVQADLHMRNYLLKEQGAEHIGEGSEEIEDSSQPIDTQPPKQQQQQQPPQGSVSEALNPTSSQLDPASADASGWPLLHRVVLAAVSQTVNGTAQSTAAAARAKDINVGSSGTAAHAPISDSSAAAPGSSNSADTAAPTAAACDRLASSSGVKGDTAAPPAVAAAASPANGKELCVATASSSAADSHAPAAEKEADAAKAGSRIEPASSSSSSGNTVAVGDAATAATAAAAAAARSDLPTLQEVLAVCKDVNLSGPGGFTALHLACVGPLSKLHRLTLARGTAKPVDHTDVFKKAGAGCCAIVKQLLLAGADTTALSSTGLTPLTAAACANSVMAMLIMLLHRSEAVSTKTAACGDPSQGKPSEHLWLSVQDDYECAADPEGSQVTAADEFLRLLKQANTARDRQLDMQQTINEACSSQAVVSSSGSGSGNSITDKIGDASSIAGVRCKQTEPSSIKSTIASSLSTPLHLFEERLPEARCETLPLHKAVQYGHVRVVKVLLAGWADPNYRCCHGYTPLLQAAFYKQLEIMSLLLAAGARPGVTAVSSDDVELHYAATNANWTAELVQKCVDAGCPLNGYNGVSGAGCTPLVLACSRGNTKVAHALVAAGADLDLPDKNSSMTPLHYAAMNGHLEIIDCLVAAGASLESVDSYDMTPVQVGANYGQLEACVKLVEKGAAWPTGRGAKAAGGDVVTLLVNSKACKKRNLKPSYVSVVLKAAEKRFRSTAAGGSSSSLSRKGSTAVASTVESNTGSTAAAMNDDIDNILEDLLATDSSSISSGTKSSKKKNKGKGKVVGDVPALDMASSSRHSNDLATLDSSADPVGTSSSKADGSSSNSNSTTQHDSEIKSQSLRGSNSSAVQQQAGPAAAAAAGKVVIPDDWEQLAPDVPAPHSYTPAQKPSSTGNSTSSSGSSSKPCNGSGAPKYCEIAAAAAAPAVTEVQQTGADVQQLSDKSDSSEQEWEAAVSRKHRKHVQQQQQPANKSMKQQRQQQQQQLPPQAASKVPLDTLLQGTAAHKALKKQQKDERRLARRAAEAEARKQTAAAATLAAEQRARTRVAEVRQQWLAEKASVLAAGNASELVEGYEARVAGLVGEISALMQGLEQEGLHESTLSIGLGDLLHQCDLTLLDLCHAKQTARELLLKQTAAAADKEEQEDDNNDQEEEEQDPGTPPAAAAATAAAVVGQASVLELLACDAWCYIDPAGYVQGPWTKEDILVWFQSGFFTLDLQVCPYSSVEAAAAATEDDEEELSVPSWVTLSQLLQSWAAVSLQQLQEDNNSSSDGSTIQQLQQLLPDDWFSEDDLAGAEEAAEEQAAAAAAAPQCQLDREPQCRPPVVGSSSNSGASNTQMLRLSRLSISAPEFRPSSAAAAAGAASRFELQSAAVAAAAEAAPGTSSAAGSATPMTPSTPMPLAPTHVGGSSNSNTLGTPAAAAAASKEVEPAVRDECAAASSSSSSGTTEPSSSSSDSGAELSVVAKDGWFNVATMRQKAALPPWLQPGFRALRALHEQQQQQQQQQKEAATTAALTKAEKEAAKEQAKAEGAAASVANAKVAAVAAAAAATAAATPAAAWALRASSTTPTTVAAAAAGSSAGSSKAQTQSAAAAAAAVPKGGIARSVLTDLHRTATATMAAAAAAAPQAPSPVKKEPPAVAMKSGCLVCSEASACVLLMPCKHMVVCRDCAQQLQHKAGSTCPKCGTTPKSYITVHMA